jgi:hypothetical protein
VATSGLRSDLRSVRRGIAVCLLTGRTRLFRLLINPFLNLMRPIPAIRSALNTKAAAVSRFLGALKDADKIVVNEPDKAAAAVVATLKGNVNAAAVKELWGDTEVAVRLGPDLAALLLQQAQWVVTKGTIKVGKPVAPDAVAIP